MADQPRNDGCLRELALFAGAGGGILGGYLLGWRTVCAVEIDAYCAGVLVQRQNDGTLEPFPIWDDVKTFVGLDWRGRIDVVSGGFPCQDISCATGDRGGAGIDGERSGLWVEFARIVGEVQPQYVFVENSAVLTSRGLGRVLGDLAAMGFDAQWGVLGGFDVGACTDGKRLWIVSSKSGCNGRTTIKIPDNQLDAVASSRRQFERAISETMEEEAYASVRRNPDVLARWMDRIKAAGNGQNPIVARLAWNTLNGGPQ